MPATAIPAVMATPTTGAFVIAEGIMMLLMCRSSCVGVMS